MEESCLRNTLIFIASKNQNSNSINHSVTLVVKYIRVEVLLPASTPAVIYSLLADFLGNLYYKFKQLLYLPWKAKPSFCMVLENYYSVVAIPKRTLGLSLPLLPVPPLTGAAGASGMEPFNPRRRTMKAEEYNNVLHISTAV